MQRYDFQVKRLSESILNNRFSTALQRKHGIVRSSCTFVPMPDIARLSFPEGHELSFWQFDDQHESLDERIPFSEKDLEESKGLNHSKRIREWLASRAALRIGLGINEEVLYHPNGKPYLPSSELSFSHCLPIAGALVHPERAGMDIQLPNPKLEVISKKFAHPEELVRANESGATLDYLTILWSAKEAVFKVYGENFQFSVDLRVDPFQVGDSSLSMETRVEGNWKSHSLRCFRILEHWVVVVL